MAGFNHVLWEMPKPPSAAQPNFPLVQVAQRDNTPLGNQMDSLYPLREMMRRKLKLGKAAHTNSLPKLTTIPKSDVRYDISTLPTTFISSLCALLDAPTIIALRATNRILMKKTKKPFNKLFTSVKIALTPRSLAVLEYLSMQKDVAVMIKHINIGTEALNQYVIPTKKMQLDNVSETKQEFKRQFEAGVEEETEARNFMVEALKHCLLRLPKLKDVTIEDRPVHNSTSTQGERSWSFMGSSHISRLTGLDFSWNGPYEEPAHEPPRTKLQDTFPVWSRNYTFITVFLVLRELRIMGTEVKLDMKLGGYLRFEGDEKASFAVPFEHQVKMARDALNYHARKLEVRDVETEGWAHGLVIEYGLNKPRERTRKGRKDAK